MPYPGAPPERRRPGWRPALGAGAALVLSALAAVGVGGPAAAQTAYAGDQWGLSQIHAPAAWASGTGSGVRIGIVDTGVDAGH
jgi:subtilisin family serine protease